MQLVIPFLYIVVLYGAFIAGSFQLRLVASAHPPGQPAARPPLTTIIMTLVLATLATLQFFYPAILTTLERDTARFLAGDWWRIVTALFVQDGGVVGSIFNLVSLLLIGSMAKRVWGSCRWLIVFFGCGVLSEVVALAWQPVGAGNSVANFGLAASVAVWCLASSQHWPVRIIAAVALLAGVPLLLLHNIHGAATLIGVILGGVLLATSKKAHT